MNYCLANDICHDKLNSPYAPLTYLAYAAYLLQKLAHSILNHCDTIEVKSVSEVLEELSITEQEYENELKISDDNSYQFHLRRPTDSCFVNNYFDKGLLVWEVNIDIIKLSLICVAIIKSG